MPSAATRIDGRYALTASWQQPLGRLYSGTAGISFSTEYDYTHAGAPGTPASSGPLSAVAWLADQFYTEPIFWPGNQKGK